MDINDYLRNEEFMKQMMARISHYEAIELLLREKEKNYKLKVQYTELVKDFLAKAKECDRLRANSTAKPRYKPSPVAADPGIPVSVIMKVLKNCVGRKE